MERWASIEGAIGYEVSDHGRVRSVARVVMASNRWGRIGPRKYPARNRKLSIFGNGYLSVQLGLDPKQHLVHRLVAQAFVPGNAELTVNHKDGIRSNNHYLNLEWLSQSDNVKHSYKHLDRKAHAKTTAVSVGGTVYQSMLDAANALGVSAGTIHSALNRGHRCKGMEVAYG